MVDDLLARKMLGERSAHRVLALARGARHRCGWRRDLGGFAFLQIFEQELGLRDLGHKLLGRAAELHAAEHRQLRLELRDEELGPGQFGARRRQLGPEQGVFAGGVLGVGYGRDPSKLGVSAPIVIAHPSQNAVCLKPPPAVATFALARPNPAPPRASTAALPRVGPIRPW